MRIVMAGMIALLATGSAQAQSLMDGFYRGQMQGMCVQAMQAYLAGKGAPPPPVCSSVSQPQQPVYQPQPQTYVRPTTRCTWIGQFWTCQ